MTRRTGLAHTLRNYPRLQTPCVNCSHPEWDHYGNYEGSHTACDSGGCICYEFQPSTEAHT